MFTVELQTFQRGCQAIKAHLLGLAPEFGDVSVASPVLKGLGACAYCGFPAEPFDALPADSIEPCFVTWKGLVGAGWA